MDSARLKNLKAQIKTFPNLPGVYLMRAADQSVIYVGKAKSLKNRVGSYFRGFGDGRYQIVYLLERVHKIEKIVVASEEQALVLERDLIKKFKPRYNIMLKDDKSYLSVRLDENAQWPRLELVRRVEQDGARYYGPFTYSYQLRELLEIIQRVVPLRNCSNTVFFNRQRPCLEYQIKRCAGPCCLPVDREQYQIWVRQAAAILEGRTKDLIKEFKENMEAEAKNLNFEEAARLRDRLEVLENFSKGQAFSSPGAEDRDVFGLYREGRLATPSLLRVRLGRIAESENYSFSDVEVADQEILSAAVAQLYQGGAPIPPELILPLALEKDDFGTDWLSKQKGSAIAFTVPERGLKSRLLSLAELNAREHFVSTFNAEAKALNLAQSLAKFAKLGQIPREIECLDISNLQGSDIVGAIVAFYDGVPKKENYKQYRLSFEGKPDDFAAVHEVVHRRLERGLEEQDLPDLLIVDGGKGQLDAALAARDRLGSKLEIIALAKERSGDADSGGKKPERLFLAGQNESIPLLPDTELCHFLARIRDEAHRFVINFHRRRRAKRVIASVLDGIGGLGAKRKRRLLKAFGSISAITEAGAAELSKKGKIPLGLAERVKESLK